MKLAKMSVTASPPDVEDKKDDRLALDQLPTGMASAPVQPPARGTSPNVNAAPENQDLLSVHY